MSFGGEELVQNNQPGGAMRLSAYADGTSMYTSMMPLNNNGGGGQNNNGENNFMPPPPLPMLPQQPEEQGGNLGGINGVHNDDSLNLLPVKRKRGRPRKYMTDEPITSPHSQPQYGSPVASDSGGGGGASSFGKKSRGRPLGSGKKNKLAALGISTGFGFVPHVITLKPGEDVLSRIKGFPQNSKRSVTILSACGTISNVTIRQASTRAVNLEGRFEILTLNGFLPFPEIGDEGSRPGLLITLAAPDGRVMGGTLENVLIAASSVQVVLGSFAMEETKGSKLANHSDGLSAPSMPESGIHTTASPLSHGTLSESSGGPMSPNNHGMPVFNGNPQGIPDMHWG